MNRKSLSYLVTGLSSITALLLHAYLVWEFFQVKFSIGASGNSFCSISEKFDCAAVAASPYSAVFGIPVAQFGLWTNLVLAVLLFCHWLTNKITEDSGPLVRFGLLSSSGLLAIGTVTMGSIALFAMKTYCLFCMATYVLSIISILGVVSLLRSELKGWFRDFKPMWLLPILLIPVGSWLTHAIIMDQLGGKKLPLIIQESVLEWQNNPSHTFDYSTGVTYGNSSFESSKYVIVEFVDLFCPHCKFASTPLKAFIKSRPEVALLVKLFPLDGQCNSALGSDGDGFRCKWSSVVVCANQKGQGPQTLNWIFDHQSELAQKSFDVGLKDLLSSNPNLNESDLSPCIEDEGTLKTIQSMAEEGKKAGIKGTPTIFLNTRQLPRGQLIPVLEAAIKSL
jgi:protein-disulfide isomerase/uncharacterized membrane protein